MRLTQVLLAGTALLALAAPAGAGHARGWYIGLEGGGSWIDDTSARLERSSAFGAVANDRPVEIDTGWALFATAGYAFSERWRIEAEFGYRHNKASSRWVAFDSIVRWDGEIDEYSLMANAIYSLPLSDRLRFSIGAGIGADDVRIDNLPPFVSVAAPDNDWRFAAQGLAGLDYALSERWDLTLTYRYLQLDGPTFGPASNGSLSQTYSFDDLGKHSVSIGLRYDLFPDEAPAAAPPPPPPPPPPAVKQFIVFFGFDKCNVTEEADRVLSEAAAAAKSSGAPSVRIVGHTDTSGSNAYNQRLSDCRANAAKSNLVGKGIPDAAISASGRGETELMVQTGDGVKEPQNRRATIDLQ